MATQKRATGKGASQPKVTTATTATSATTAKTEKYRDLISKSEQEVETEMLDLNVKLAKNTLEQGTLQVQSQMLNKLEEVKKAESAVATAQRDLKTSISAHPLNVQSILNARKSVLVNTVRVEEARAEYEQVQEAHDFLVQLSVDLF